MPRITEVVILAGLFCLIFGYALIPIIGGIVVTASGYEVGVIDPAEYQIKKRGIDSLPTGPDSKGPRVEAQFWGLFNQHTSWDMFWDNNGEWQKMGGLNIKRDYVDALECKITISFIAPQSGDWRIELIISQAEEYYSESESAVILNWRGQHITYDWSDIAELPNLEFDHRIEEALFFFDIIIHDVQQGEKIELDPSIVASTSTNTSTFISAQRKSWYSDGRHWLIYTKETDGTKPGYFASSTDGDTWTNETELIYVVKDGFGYEFSCFYDGDYVHIAVCGRLEGDSGIDLLYRRGDPNSDGSITWTAAWYKIYDGWATGPYHARPTITVDSDNYPWICTVMKLSVLAEFAPYAWKSSRNDGIWSTSSGFPYQINPDNHGTWWCSAVPLTDQDMYIIYSYGDALMMGRKWESGYWHGGEYFSDYWVDTYGDRYSAVSVNDTIYVAYRANNGGTKQIRLANGTYGDWSATDYLVQDSMDSWGVPVLTKNITDLTIFWGGTPTGHHMYYRQWTVSGGWAARVDWFTDTSWWWDSLTGFYENYGEWAGVAYTHGSPVDYIKYENMSLSGVPPPPPTPPAITFGDFEIDNMDAGTWLFAEEKFYNFNLTATVDANYSIRELKVRFDDGAARNVTLYYRNDTGVGGIEYGNDIADISLEETSATQVNHTLEVQWKVNPRIAIVDELDVDFLAWGNTTLGNITSWETVKLDYSDLYARGGMEADITQTGAGASGRTTGGDVWELYATSAASGWTTIKSAVYWRNIVHWKLQYAFEFPEVDGGTFPEFHNWFGVDYYTGGSWVEGWSVRIRASEFQYVWHDPPQQGDSLFCKYNVTWFERGNEIKNDQDVWGFWEIEGRLARIWVDIWFNRINASSVCAGRVSSYEHAMYQRSNNIYAFWFGPDWSPMGNKTQSMFFGRLRDINNATIHAKEIQLVRAWSEVRIWERTPATTTDMQDFDTFEMLFTTRYLEGIQTPTFLPTKHPVMPRYHMVAAAIFAPIVSQFFSAAMPALQGFSSWFLTLLDGVIFALTGQSGVATGIAAFFVGMISSAWSFITAMTTSVTHFSEMVLDTFNAFFTNIFSPLWGIFEFVIANPVMSLWDTLGSIVGISGAWLSGTTYTNAWGQVYDFSYLSTMTIPGTSISGGIVVFYLIFIVGTFIQILMCFAKMSIEPIRQPIMLFWSVILFGIRIFQIMWTIGVGIVKLIFRILNTIRNYMPKIPFT